ncbi:hypothetical protein T440DRAFT_156376 [Plenodomus tracheiphilus IPT5]|uniref:Secreted protein n=1 Tax=Plenodomus tracheiphilus IPT5 TaxID=1408161 RepID=A0A6A7BL43_9PLEO|nr:hypothetical protein T440DRAFT_156376 [Plenodomus tracheiphilus IPT5]
MHGKQVLASCQLLALGTTAWLPASSSKEHCVYSPIIYHDCIVHSSPTPSMSIPAISSSSLHELSIRHFVPRIQGSRTKLSTRSSALGTHAPPVSHTSAAGTLAIPTQPSNHPPGNPPQPDARFKRNKKRRR